MLPEIKYVKTMILEIKLFIKRLKKKIVLVEEPSHIRKISQNEKQKEMKIGYGCESVLDIKLLHTYNIALVIGSGM